MLSYDLLKNHAGIVLIGDYTSFRWLHEIIHDVNERSPLIENKEGAFLSLAYDVRKAYEGKREILPPPEHSEEIGTRYGVKILWPVFLLQQRMLRYSLGYIDSNKKHQAITYAVEHIIESALMDDFGTQGAAIVDHWQRLHPSHPETFNRLHSRGAIYCSWTKAKRKRYIQCLLASFSPMYETLYRMRVRDGEKNLVAPEEFNRWTDIEWPDPRW